MRPVIDSRGKTIRAFNAYLDVLDTAEWIRRKLRGQLEFFDLTVAGFRVLELLHREGPVYIRQAADRLMWLPQDLHKQVKELEAHGWVSRHAGRLPPSESRRHATNESQGAKREGRMVMLVSLTPAGEKCVAHVFPKHAKFVRALMRALHGQEQVTLGRLCRKLREGDPVRFYREMVHEDV